MAYVVEGPPDGSLSMARRIARWSAAVNGTTLDRRVLDKTRLCLIDMIGVAAQAHDLPWSRQATAYAAMMGGQAATLIGSSAQASVTEAAFANATMAHGLVQEDVHPPSMSHIGVVIWPTLLALSEHERVPGPEFIVAGLIGYQVMGRLGAVLITGDVAQRFRPTGLIGAVGAAAAGARLLRLSEDETVHALGLAANTASGLNEWAHAGGGEMFFHAGFAARNAVTSVLLARLGATASESALDGRAGLFASFGGMPRAVLDLGGAWEVLAVYHKPAPVCNFAQTPAQAALAVRRVNGVRPDEIDHVVVRSFPAAITYPGCDHAGPYHSQIQAKMSIQFTVAAVLAHGRLDDGVFRGYESDSETLRLAADVHLQSDAEFSDSFPRRQGAEVLVSLRDGRNVSHRLVALEPLDPAGVRRRCRVALSQLLGEAHAEALEREIEMVTNCPDAAIIARLLGADDLEDDGQRDDDGRTE